MKETNNSSNVIDKNYDRHFRTFGEFAARPDNPGDENKRHPTALAKRGAALKPGGSKSDRIRSKRK